MADKNMSVVRVERITMSGIQKAERYNERKNESYANVNVDTDRSRLNVHYSDTGGLTCTEYFNGLVEQLIYGSFLQIRQFLILKKLTLIRKQFTGENPGQQTFVWEIEFIFTFLLL